MLSYYLNERMRITTEKPGFLQHIPQAKSLMFISLTNIAHFCCKDYANFELCKIYPGIVTGS